VNSRPDDGIVFNSAQSIRHSLVVMLTQISEGKKMMRSRLSRIATTGVVVAQFIALSLSACVPAQQYDALETDYNQLNQRLSGEIASQQVHITRLQGAIKVAVNSDLLFPSGGWQMPPQAAQTISEMAPILARFQQTTIIVTGYTDNVPIGPELQRQGIASNEQLSLMRAQTVANFLISQGVKPNLVQTRGLGDTDPVASNDTPQGRAQNRRVELTLAGPGT
jgi:chemotaxis protein MotB